MNYQKAPIWFLEAIATSLSNQYNTQNLVLNCSLEELLQGKVKYNQYFVIGIYLLNSKGKDYILELSKNPKKLEDETEIILNEAKNFIKKWNNNQIENIIFKK